MQVGESLRSELARIIRQELRDPDLALATVTDVEISPDLHFARVWISALGEQEKREAALAAVRRADGTIRHHLAKARAFRYIPEIDWKLDQSAVYAGTIESRLREVLPPSAEEADGRAATDDGQPGPAQESDDHD